MEQNTLFQILEASPSGYAHLSIVLNDDGQPYDYEFIDINPAFAKLLGCSKEEALGARVSQLILDLKPDELDLIRSLGEQFQNGIPSDFQFYSRAMNCIVRIWAVPTDSEHVTAYVLDPVYVDRNNPAESLPNLYNCESWESLKGELLFISPSCKRLTGYDADAFRQDSLFFESLVLKEDRHLWNAHRHQVLELFQNHQVQFRIMHHDRHIVWIERTSSPLYDSNGQCLGFQTHNRDITDLKRSEETLRESEWQFHRIIETLPFSLTIVHLDGTIMYANTKAFELFNVDRNVIGTKTTFMLWRNPERRQTWLDTLNHHGVIKDFEVQLRTWSGKAFWALCSGLIVKYQGEPCVLSTQHDISERKAMEVALRASEEKYRMLTENASDVLWIWNITRSVYTYMGPNIYQFRGITAEEAMQESIFCGLLPDSNATIRNTIVEHLDEFLKNPEEPKCYLTEMQQQRKDGSFLWVESSCRYRYNEEGEIEILGVSRSIDERKKTEQQVLYLSYHDQLTELYNRRYYEEELRRIDVDRNLPITLIMADVNGLKLVNDAFGHVAGDQLLLDFTEFLKDEFRQTDFIARTGGDEFIILLPGTRAEEVSVIMDRVVNNMAHPHLQNNLLSASFGWATKIRSAEKMDHIFTLAENHMYRNKLIESSKMKAETLKLITQSLYAKDKFANRHADNVSALCQAMGQAMGMTLNEIEFLGQLGALHDIGKIAISDYVVQKVLAFDDADWKDVHRHPETGYQILRSISDYAHLAESVLCHHERMDGGGYPRGLHASQIPIYSKILSVADAYESMIHDNEYKPQLTQMEAVEELHTHAGTQFDSEIVQLFIGSILKEPVRDTLQS